MLKTRLTTALLFGVGVGLGLAHLPAFSQSGSASAPPVKEIHVDRSCKVLLESSAALSGYGEEDLRNDHVICHLESVFKSHHVEEALRDGGRQRSKVTIREQEYLLQNVTAEPVTFVVEHVLPDDWTVDSDPQPIKVVGNTAYFRVSAEPGEIVRLHVGERHAVPMADGD
jgi:hypothetical protein